MPLSYTFIPHMERLYEEAREPMLEKCIWLPEKMYITTEIEECFTCEDPEQLSLFESRFLPMMSWIMERDFVDPSNMERFSTAATRLALTVKCLFELGYTHVSWRFFVVSMKTLVHRRYLLCRFFKMYTSREIKLPRRFAMQGFPDTPLLCRLCVANDNAPFMSNAWECYKHHLFALLYIQWNDGYEMQERYVKHLESWGRPLKMPRVTAEMTSRMLQKYVPDDMQDPVAIMKFISSSRRKRRREQREDLPPPDEFMCPIYLELMEDPVCTPCGHIFEHQAISKIADQSDHTPEGMWRCPVCRACLWPGSVRKDVSLYRLIQWWKRGFIPRDLRKIL